MLLWEEITSFLLAIVVVLKFLASIFTNVYVN